MMPDLIDMLRKILRVIDKEIGSDSERTRVYSSTLVELAQQARLADESLEMIDGPDLADLRQRLLKSCERHIGDDRGKMLRYAQAAKNMALYERLVSGGSSNILALRRPSE